MRTSLLTVLITLTCLIANAQSTVRLKYRNFTQASAGVLNTFPTDSTVMGYPNNQTTLALNDLVYQKTQANQSADSVSKTLYSYDQNGNETQAIKLRRTTGNPWENFYKTDKLYDNQGRMIDYTFSSWMNGLWREVRQTIIGYNSAGNEFSRTEKDTVSGILTNSNFYGTYYDTLDRKTLYTWQKWVNGNWQFYLDEEYYYKGNSNLLDSVIHKFWDVNTNSKKKAGRTTFVYNGQNRVTKAIRENIQGNQYVYSSMLEYGYDNSGRRNATVSYNWSSSDNTWIPNSGDYYTFDALGRITESILKQRNNTTLQLENRGKNEYIFAPDSSLITDRSYNWSNNNWQISGQNVWVFETVGTTGIINEQPITSLRAYPNPFLSNTLIEFESNESSPVQIHITDLNGRTVYQQNMLTVYGKNALLWDATSQNGESLHAGMYLLQLISQRGTSNFKLIKN